SRRCSSAALNSSTDGDRDGIPRNVLHQHPTRTDRRRPIWGDCRTDAAAAPFLQSRNWRRNGRNGVTLGKEAGCGRPATSLVTGPPMSTTASDVLVETLLAWGVDTVFGIPGDGINGIIEAFRKRQDKIRFIQV